MIYGDLDIYGTVTIGKSTSGSSEYQLPLAIGDPLTVMSVVPAAYTGTGKDEVRFFDITQPPFNIGSGGGGGGGASYLDDLLDVSISTPKVDQTIKYNGTTFVNADINSLKLFRTQASHGFVVGDVIGSGISSIQKVSSSAGSASYAIGIVSKVQDVNTYQMCTSGYLSATPFVGLSNGQYYLGSTPGSFTLVAPSATNQVVKPLFTVIASGEVIVNILEGIINP